MTSFYGRAIQHPTIQGVSIPLAVVVPESSSELKVKLQYLLKVPSNWGS